MAQKQNQDMSKIGFKSIQLLKTQTLGIGSYGQVCKAKCDDLLCAAKIIHPTLYNPIAQQQIARHTVHRLPFRRFQQECEFLRAIRHPNIVLYLGTHRDPETNLPILLMELMDNSLTNFLESSKDPVLYHIQVNFCHDITLAISYLHSNGIIHRDLSSNNVLLRGNAIAKVTDFGMAKLLNNTNSHATHTMTPGADVYMPPEAVKEQPTYTEKLDCFSIGVLTIQILTRQWPEPADRQKGVLEIERRQTHISKVDPNHPLLPIALHCLKDSGVKRPSAQEISHRVIALKETPKYTESVRSARDIIQDKDEVIHQIVRDKDNVIRMRDDIIHRKEQECQQLKEAIRELQELTQPLQTSEQVTADTSDTAPARDRFELLWKMTNKAPCKISRGPDAVIDGDMVYFRLAGTQKIYVYNLAHETWNQLPDCPFEACSLAVIDNLLTTIGGRNNDIDKEKTNQLFSLTGKGRGKKWSQVFPPMPTKRTVPIAICTGQALIVAGGSDQKYVALTTVEVMKISSKQWSSAADLPEPLSDASATICGKSMYILGGYGVNGPIDSVYTCSLADLFLSCRSRFLRELLTRSISLTIPARSIAWNKVADLPVTRSTCVTLHGRLLAIGGCNSNWEPTSDIHIYNTTSNQWEIANKKMKTPRFSSLAAALPKNQLMVIGGYTEHTFGSRTNLVEMGTVIL